MWAAPQVYSTAQTAEHGGNHVPSGNLLRSCNALRVIVRRWDSKKFNVVTRPVFVSGGSYCDKARRGAIGCGLVAVVERSGIALTLVTHKLLCTPRNVPLGLNGSSDHYTANHSVQLPVSYTDRRFREFYKFSYIDGSTNVCGMYLHLAPFYSVFSSPTSDLGPVEKGIVTYLPGLA